MGVSGREEGGLELLQGLILEAFEADHWNAILILGLEAHVAFVDQETRQGTLLSSWLKHKLSSHTLHNLSFLV